MALMDNVGEIVSQREKDEEREMRERPREIQMRTGEGDRD